MGNFVVVHSDDGSAATAVPLSGSCNDVLRGDGSVGTPTNPTLDEVVDALYPVGSIYLSTLSTNPATLLGRGTWVAFGAGRALVGLDSGDADFNAAEKTGGAKTVAAAGTVAAPTFTGTQATISHSGTAVADHAAHTHAVTSNVAVADHAAHTHAVTSNVAVADHASHTHSVTAAGTNSAPTFTGSASTAASTIAAPKLVTANTSTGVAPVVTPAGTVSAPTFTGSSVTSGAPSATLAHTVTNNAVTSGSPSATLSHTVTNNAVTSGNPSATLSHTVTQPNDHTLTPAGTNSAPTFTGSATSVVQPYITCYIWKRTA